MSLRQVFFFICLMGLFPCSKEKSPEQAAECVKSSLTSGVTKTWAPSSVGDYPYVCTFPGHWTLMNGVMKVSR